MIRHSIPADEHGMFEITTLSGSTYILTALPGEHTLRRVPDLTAGDPMRRDDEALTVLSRAPIAVGSNADFLLEPLGEGDVTHRSTNIVSAIRDIELPVYSLRLTGEVDSEESADQAGARAERWPDV